MSAIVTQTGARGCRRWSHGLAALAFAWGGNALAQEVVAVPAAHLNHAEGSVAYAPQGDKEWHDVQPRRVLKRGDRLWTDRGSRAEVQAGGHALRMNGESQLLLENVTPNATQLSLTQGSLVATVTHLNAGDSFELGTPNLAFRARQPGDFRFDVDTRQGITRVVVLTGTGVVYGEKGEALEIRTGQRVTFKERSLARVQAPAFAATDEFDRWSGARRRGEPTVSMPAVAAAPAPAIPTAPVSTGRTIVIPGGPMQAVAKATPIPSTLPQGKPAATQVAVVTPAPVSRVLAPMPAPAPTSPAPVAAAPLTPTAPAAPSAAQVQAQAQARASADAKAAEAQAAAQAKAKAAAAARAAQVQAAREQQERQRQAQQRAEQQRHAAARAEQDRRVAVAETRRAEDRRRAAVAAKRAEDERRQHGLGKREQEQKRLAARRAEDERRIAQVQARKAAEEKRLAAKRAVEAQKIAEARRHQLARLQEQARRDEQSVQARREQARRTDEDRREELVRREEQARREDLARREEDLRRQRALADQARRDQERREQEVWLRQQQQPARPVPMGVPIRRVS